MANPNNPHSFLWEKTDQSGAVKLRRFVTVSNTTLSVGDPVVVLSGYVKLAGITSVALFGFAAEAVTGVAATRKSVAIIPAIDGYTFSAQVKSGTNLTVGYLGTKGGIAGTTNGKIGFSSTATTSVLQIIGLKKMPGNNWGTYAQLMLKVVRSGYEGSIR
jgi:hypothetical protein